MCVCVYSLTSAYVNEFSKIEGDDVDVGLWRDPSLLPVHC